MGAESESDPVVHDADIRVMGFFFGFLHLAYGIYLYLTQERNNAA